MPTTVPQHYGTTFHVKGNKVKTGQPMLQKVERPKRLSIMVKHIIIVLVAVFGAALFNRYHVK